jgi:uracil permease
VVEILVGLLIMRIGKEALDRVLPPIITGSVAVVIGIALAGAALGSASTNWGVALITLIVTIVFSVYLQGKGLIGMLPILLGAIVGWIIAIPLGALSLADVAAKIAGAPLVRVPAFTLPAFGDPNAWAAVTGIALIAIATIPESTAHLYQMSLYIDQLAKELGRPPVEIKRLIGLNLISDGSDDLVVGFLGGCAGTNYGENNSLMAITRCYSVPVLIVAGIMAILLGFVGTLAAIVETLPTAVVGGLSIYLFGVIGMQGIALIQSEKVNLFEPRNLAVGATILVAGIGGAMSLKDGLFPFPIPVIFPSGIPAIVFAAILGILVNVLFLVLPPSMFGVQDRENIND